MELKKAVDSYMQRVPEVRDYCQRCLKTERWDGNVLVMVVDAAFTSIGLSYFQSVVPNVDRFREKFVEKRKIFAIECLLDIREGELEEIWRNKRSWQMAKSVVFYLVKVKKEKELSDKEALIYWASQANLENWEQDPIGEIKGVGINTFQYLRMMGGIDTVMPDKIVKRVIGEILSMADSEMPATDIGFVRMVEQIAKETGYRAIELCWMTWLIQSEGGLIRTEKYSYLLPRI